MAYLICKICEVKFESSTLLLSHINIHLGRKCKTCTKFYKSVLTNNEPQNYDEKCKQSHLWIAQQSSLKSSQPSPPPSCYITKTHITSTHPPPHTLQCQYCSYSTHCNTRFKKHMRCHTNERPFKCDKCGKAFTVRCNLKSHILSVHEKERNFKCKYCGNGFIRSDRLKEHERIHTGEKPLTCEFCSQRFATSSRLNKHKKKHTGYQCRFCSEKFKNEYQLKQHKKAEHSDIIKTKAKNFIAGKRWFPFGCKYCGLRFLEKDLLETHRKEHDGLICSKCDTLFVTKNATLTHEGTCEGIKIEKEVETTQNHKKTVRKTGKSGVEFGACDGKQHYCMDCGRYFPSGPSLGGHRASAHRNEKRKKKKKRRRQIKKDTNDPNKDCAEHKEESLHNKNTTECGEVEDSLNVIDNRKGYNIYKTEEQLSLDLIASVESSNGKKEDKQNKKKEIEVNKDCPGRHGLISTMTPNNRVFECAECNKTMYLNEEMYRCKWCDYDLCVACFKGETSNDIEVDECKTMSCDFAQNETESDYNTSVKNIEQHDVLLSKKRKREIHDSGVKSPQRKKRKRFIIRIPRVKKNVNTS